MKIQSTQIHPELRQFVKFIPRFHFSEKNLWLVNFVMKLLPSPKIVNGISVENIVIPGQDSHSNIRLRLYWPASTAAPAPVLLWFHGGGYILGKPEMDDGLCAYFAHELGITVVAVDYRLAPKYPFPAGLEDGYAALKWVSSNSNELNIDPERIAIGGGSAGGGLAAALSQLAHDKQEIEPVFQLLVYPMLDDRTVLRKDIDDDSHVIWSQKSNRFGWESYLSQECGAENAPTYSVPARRTDLSGLSPAWIGVGSLDIFHEENTVYGQRLNECGTECEIKVIPGAFHGFDVFKPDLPIVQEFRKSQIAALKKYLVH